MGSHSVSRAPTPPRPTTVPWGPQEAPNQRTLPSQHPRQYKGKTRRGESFGRLVHSRSSSLSSSSERWQPMKMIECLMQLELGEWGHRVTGCLFPHHLAWQQRFNLLWVSWTLRRMIRHSRLTRTLPPKGWHGVRASQQQRLCSMSLWRGLRTCGRGWSRVSSAI